MTNETSQEPIVALKTIKRHFKQGESIVRAVDGVDLEIRPGEFTVLSGPSGSGKTTILNLIGALDSPTEGEVWVESRNLVNMSRAELSKFRRDRIGFVFQAYNLIPVLTAFENAEFILALQGLSLSERKERVFSLMNDFGLEGLENRRPDEMSGGQQQRIAIIRAIVTDPAIILADEPTANVDSKTVGIILDLMEKLNRQRQATFLFSSHDPQVTERARRIIHLKDGHVEKDERRNNSDEIS